MAYSGCWKGLEAYDVRSRQLSLFWLMILSPVISHSFARCPT